MRTSLWMFSLFCHLIFLPFDACAAWFLLPDPTPPILTLSCCHSQGRRVMHSEHISHRLWVTECFIQKFHNSEALEAHFVCFHFEGEQHNAFWVCDVYIAHKSWTDSQAKSKKRTIQGICNAFNSNSQALQWYILDVFWLFEFSCLTFGEWVAVLGAL